MPRFMVERDFGHISEEGLKEIAARSDSVAAERFPDIVWEHSHVCANDDGSVKAFCVYEAPSMERIHEHTDQVPDLSMVSIYEIVGTLTPEAALV